MTTNPHTRSTDADSRFAAARDALLERVGGALSLADAAKEMGISSRAQHKRIAAGTALGMMRGNEIVVPKLQLVPGHGKKRGKKVVLSGVDRVVKLFRDAEAGPWAALQFLVGKDPNLRHAPIDALKSGDVEAIEHAARAYLGPTRNEGCGPQMATSR